MCPCLLLLLFQNKQKYSEDQCEVLRLLSKVNGPYVWGATLCLNIRHI